MALSPITNRRKVAVADTDVEFYPTPEWATEALLRVEHLGESVLEPACGDGAMARVLGAAGYDVVAFDLVDRGYGLGEFNFLEQPDEILTDAVVTNPPFDIAQEFVEKALRVARRKVCMLLRLAFLEGQKRLDTLYSVTPPSRVWVFSKRITFYPAGKVMGGSGTTAYAWFVWDKESDVTHPELRWL